MKTKTLVKLPYGLWVVADEVESIELTQDVALVSPKCANGVTRYLMHVNLKSGRVHSMYANTEHVRDEWVASLVAELEGGSR